ncbi:MAG: hypothetical protein PVG07_01605 [Acidobacteriota bacterium]|jgi:hypothetical protein
MADDPITRLFRSCAPNEALQPDDLRYVNCDEVRGENLAQLYARALRRADPVNPEVKVFSGHRGVGKTSELYRLKRFLEQPDESGQRPFLVIFSDVSQSLDLNDTVPISLIYSPRFTQIEQTFGGHQIPVPMIRLHEKGDSEPTMDTPGMAKLREILEARCRHAEVDFSEVFDEEETCRHLCRMTGGHPRHLMMFLRAAANEVDALPITGQAVDKAIRNYANSLLREVPDAFWPLLRNFDEPQDDLPKDENHQEMLLLLHVFEYMNGEPWYEVNPVLRTIPKFRET